MSEPLLTAALVTFVLYYAIAQRAMRRRVHLVEVVLAQMILLQVVRTPRKSGDSGAHARDN